MEKGSDEVVDAPKGHGANTERVPTLDFIARIVAFVATLAAAIVMLTANQTLRFQTQFLHFRAEYYNLPTFTFFVVANVIASGYLLLSLPFSIINIVRSSGKKSKIIFIVFDTVTVSLLMAAASAAAGIVYLAHYGNPEANWLPICRQFKFFCKHISGSLIGSFLAIVLLTLLILLSAVTLYRRKWIIKR